MLCQHRLAHKLAHTLSVALHSNVFGLNKGIISCNGNPVEEGEGFCFWLDKKKANKQWSLTSSKSEIKRDPAQLWNLHLHVETHHVRGHIMELHTRHPTTRNLWVRCDKASWGVDLQPVLKEREQ